MKRALTFCFTFLITLGLGTAADWIFTVEKSESVIPETQVENTEVSPLPTSDQRDKFNPEFLDLPQPDYDYYDDLRLHGKLVHVAGGEIYRRSEVVAKTGQSWFVLTKHGTKYAIRKSTARVQKLNSVSWPGDEKDSKLNFRVGGKPILALRGVQGINSGSVVTLFLDESRIDPDAIIKNEEMSNGYRREFNLNDHTYTLRVSSALSIDGTELAVLVLESDGTTQILEQTSHVPGDRDIIGDLIWAGDLDGDQKLDLYFDQFNEIGAFSSSLYLSTHAKEGKLLDLAAVFNTSGC